MTTLTSQSALEANLAALGEHNADLVRLLRETASSSEIEFLETDEPAPGAIFRGRPLASRRRPLSEGRRLVEHADLVEHAVFVINGFGLGHHVRALAERLEKRGLIIVFEPDLPLLRAVFERIDHARWLAKAHVIFVTDAADRGGLARRLQGCESMLALGIEFLDHPASRTRLGHDAITFSASFRDHMASAKTNMVTTLIRSLDTVRNNLLNLDHYAAGAGVAELRRAASGFPAVIVSAGPSLHRNIHLLAKPGVRDRCVIIAAQTTLKPLLAAGVRPHFVTALDYHEISKRFYEDIPPQSLDGVTLVAEPKAHPVILDSFPGPVRCCRAEVLDQVLGDLKRDMGVLPAGATVAHLAMYLARHLGCDPICFIGQDLGFPDGLYYAPGTAIEHVWAPELSPFNTMEMMQWQRIVRHRAHLRKAKDASGRSIYTDQQMATYLNQFERDFAIYREEGVEIIDATEGGVAKQHATSMPLAEVLARHATRPLPALPAAPSELDGDRLAATRRRAAEVRRSIVRLREVSRRTVALLNRMLDDQDDAAKMASHFRRMDRYRGEVERRMEAFNLVNHLNQLGAFKRLKADRRLNMQEDLAPLERQRAELQRDLTNVQWIEDAATEMIDLLATADRVLAGEPVECRSRMKPDLAAEENAVAEQRTAGATAMIAIDPERHDPAAAFGDRPILQATLERLGASETLDSIILIVPRGHDIEPLIDRSRIGLPVHIEPCDGSPFGPEHEAVLAARRFSPTCWRGGIAGLGIHDEVLAPAAMHEIMRARGIDAAVVVGPGWPLVQVTGEQGIDAIVRRHVEAPAKLDLVFTQAPPGLGGCLVGAELMKQLAARNRLSTVGALLVYQPHAPQHDPIARDNNVQIDHRVRDSLVRATLDSPDEARLVDAALAAEPALAGCSAPDVVSALERASSELPVMRPRHIILELTPRRESRGVFRRSLLGNGRHDSLDRPDLSIDTARRLVDQLGAEADLAITVGGCGDPLLHADFDEIISILRPLGPVHVRTELLADRAALDRLLTAEPAVISIDLHADRAATYETMMGCDRFREVLTNLDHLIAHRRRLTAHDDLLAFALPWIVPRLQRRAETYDDLESFYDRWQHRLGHAVIEAPPPFPADADHPADTLMPAGRPAKVDRRALMERMTILSDGSVPLTELDITGSSTVGNVHDAPLPALWTDLLARRRGLGDEEMRTLLP